MGVSSRSSTKVNSGELRVFKGNTGQRCGCMSGVKGVVVVVWMAASIIRWPLWQRFFFNVNIVEHFLTLLCFEKVYIQFLEPFCSLVIDERLNLFDDDDAEKPELDITTTTEYYQYTSNTIGGQGQKLDAKMEQMCIWGIYG
ncbi:hypothetical protein DERP_006489 [Dermatophagoides pteronyssinus]|uniref:Uncharacterized protein n=1 Tax=Dermatophagoides pteronyssinus TaxID=6956 RepID=A0ABQ8IQS0_DERPT|nr:hypothetical protein DERP_006489 [Dermatophagoides pteronyssinus]